MAALLINIAVFLILLIVLGFWCVYLYFQYRYCYWRWKGVIGQKPVFPFGNWTEVFQGKKHYAEVMLEIYKANRKDPFHGIFVLHNPILVVNDLEIIKNMMIKDFDHFSSHGGVDNINVDPFCENLFALSGEKWKDLRVKLSPVFTSGKMKGMFDLALNVQRNLITYLESNIQQEKEVNVKTILSSYTTDVIGSCAFGLNCNSFEDPNSEFMRAGKEVIAPLPKYKLNTFVANFLPRVAEIIGLKVQPDNIVEFYTRLVMETIKYRRENKIVRNDFLQLLIQLQNDTDDKSKTSMTLTETEIVAQCYLFFIAGFETSSTTSSYLLLHLAQEPDIQEKMRQEIKAVLSEGPVTYESLNKLPYMDMVIEETLRMHPPVSHLFRDCTKTYTIPGSNLTIDKGVQVFFSIHGLQNDPDIYPDPEKFKPGRFTKEEKAKRHKCAYMPFGEGPRQCIGLRFAMMQIRLALMAILEKYEVVATEKTTIVIDREALLATPKDATMIIKKIKGSS